MAAKEDAALKTVDARLFTDIYTDNDSRVQKIESLPEQCVDSYLLFFIKQKLSKIVRSSRKVRPNLASTINEILLYWWRCVVTVRRFALP